MSAVRWMPLESNPDVMNQFIANLGVSRQYQFTDVYGLDPELLCMVPQPCLAVILLFPVSDKYAEFREEEAKRLIASGHQHSPNVFFMKQTIGNACGTIGVIHAIANCQDKVKIEDDSILSNFFKNSNSLTPADKGKQLESNEGIHDVHTTFAQQGQTASLSAEAHVDLHFVALVHVDGSIYELDGNKQFPINHGSSSEETFLEDAAKVCREFMARDQSELRFTIVAFSKVQ
ncbi:ubiquitin carboxyl-terminal hydrolase isozyme L3-like [Clavelina lepadiformis]|uniref:Ubiquitin carboxyl-terminal hydrolase n=1 Tax=Clavelina lepadiformis TaxID=159417 RepID=A0ABP0EWC2_CLALP